MDGVLQTSTAFDTWSGVVSAALYLLVGVVALARTPRDGRARTFFIIAVASLAPYLLPAAGGRLGTGLLFTAVAIVTGVSLAVGSIALFHFTQVFPWRRPWIQSNGRRLRAAYAVLPLGAAIGTWAAVPIIGVVANISAQRAGGLNWMDVDTFSPVDAFRPLALLFVLIPTVFIIGIVLPFAALLSLYRSWQEAKRDGRDGARVTTVAILISQLAGGVLTILVVPLLGLVAPNGPWVTIAAALLFGFGLLFPIAFALGVWKYRLV